MNFKKMIAALMTVAILGGALISCGAPSEEQEPAETTTDAPIDTSAVSVPDGSDYSSLLSAALDGVPVSADADFETEVTNGKVTVKTYVGTASEVCVPATLGGLPVTAIADGAFAGNTSLQTLILPDTVEQLGKGILAGCTFLYALETPLLGADATSTQFLGYLFGANTYVNNPRDIPASLKYLRIGGTADTLPDYALFDCNDLVCVELPDTLRSVGSFALYNCASLEWIFGLENVTSFDTHALSHCASLTDLTFGAGVTSFGLAMLEGCTAIRSLVLPFVGETPTQNTYLAYLFGAEYPDFSAGYYSPVLTRVELLSTCTSLGNYAFYECWSLKELLLPEGLVSIGVRAFYGCKALWSLALPNSLKTIRESAFFGCTSLLELHFGNGLTTVGINAFYNCDSLRAADLPDSLTSLPASCFAGCTSLTSVDLGGVTSVGKNAFHLCPAISTVISDQTVSFADGNEDAQLILYPPNDKS